MKRKIISICIILGSGVFSLWTLGMFSLQVPTLDSNVVSIQKNDSLNRFAELNTNSNTLLSGNSASLEEMNVTENIAKAYGQEILKLNPKGIGKTASTQIFVPTENVLNQIIAKELEMPTVIPAYVLKDIRVKTNTNKTDEIAYLKAVKNAYDSDFKSASQSFFQSLSDALQVNSPSALQGDLNAISKHVHSLLSLEVPSNWSVFHLEMLNLWQKRFTLGSMVLTSTDDPFKAYKALQELSANLDREESLLAVLESQIKNLSL